MNTKPLPEGVSLDALSTTSDAMTALYKSLVGVGGMRMNDAMIRLDDARLAHDAAVTHAQDAAKKAQDEANDGGFFDLITKNMGVASVIGLCTFRYDMVAADILAHQASNVTNVHYDAVDLAAMANGPAALAVSLLRKSEISPELVRGNVGPTLISDADVETYKKDALVANLAVVGAACSVLTAGSTTAFWVAAVGASIALSGQVLSRTEALDGMLGDGCSRKLGFGMQIGGALFGGGASFASAGAGAAVSAATTTAVKGATATTAALRGAAGVVNGTTTAVKATDTISTAVQAKEVEEAKVELKRADFGVDAERAVVDSMVRGVIDARKAVERTLEIVQGAMETAQATNLTVVR